MGITKIETDITIYIHRGLIKKAFSHKTHTFLKPMLEGEASQLILAFQTMTVTTCRRLLI